MNLASEEQEMESQFSCVTSRKLSPPMRARFRQSGKVLRSESWRLSPSNSRSYRGVLGVFWPTVMEAVNSW
jgi:hypothetical protein